MHKAILAPLEIKADAPEGSVRAAFSIFDEIDSSKDVVVPGAFEDGAEVLMSPAHDWSAPPIGRGVIRNRAKHAEFDGEFFLNTASGREWYEAVKAAGPLQQWSFGYQVLDSEPGQHKGERVQFLKRLKVYEVSPVLVGDNQLTYTVGVKHGAEADAKATWSAAFINDLPDSAFAVILPGGEKDDEGRTTPRSLRKLPHHGADGAVDLAHLRNALSREPQADMPDDAHGRARAHLQRHARAEGVGDEGKGHDGADVKAAPLGSHEQLRERLSMALAEQLGREYESGYGYIVATYDDRVVACIFDRDRGDSYYEIPYTLDAAGMPELGEPAPVEQTFVPSTAKALAYALHTERVLADAREWATRTRWLADRRAKDGRTLSTASRARLAAMADAMRAALADLDGLLDSTDRRSGDDEEATKDGSAGPPASDLADLARDFRERNAVYVGLLPAGAGPRGEH